MVELSASSREALFVRGLYVGILNREPDADGLKFHTESLISGRATPRDLIAGFFAGDEYRKLVGASAQNDEIISPRDLRLYPGYKFEDTEIFSRFNTQGVRPTPGFLTEWIGSRVRISSLWDGCEQLDNIVLGWPIPGDYHADATEWLGTLKGVLSAWGSFSVMELGAGHGPWLSASCAAARALGIDDLHLCGVEADPGRFALLKQNMQDNNLLGEDTTLIQAAIGVTADRVRWPRIPDPRNDAGARPMRAGNEDDKAYLGHRYDDMIDVEIVALAPLLERRPIWDLVHIDIQGTEMELCTGCIKDLTARVRYLVIGTHSRKLDGDLIDLFLSEHWVLEHEKPARMIYNPELSLTMMTTHDGTQVWRNPHL